MPRLHVAENQITIESGIFFSAFFKFQLHVYDSLYSQALAFSQIPSEIALIEATTVVKNQHILILVCLLGSWCVQFT